MKSALFFLKLILVVIEAATIGFTFSVDWTAPAPGESGAWKGFGFLFSAGIILISHLILVAILTAEKKKRLLNWATLSFVIILAYLIYLLTIM